MQNSSRKLSERGSIYLNISEPGIASSMTQATLVRGTICGGDLVFLNTSDGCSGVVLKWMGWIVIGSLSNRVR